MFRTVKNKKIFEEILDQIKELLITKQLVVGNKMPSEVELAESMGVSRSSLREALKVLDILGIIEAKAGDGTIIKPAKPENLKDLMTLVALSNGIDTNELFEVRTIIEIYAARLASQRRSEEDIVQILEHLKGMENADPETETELDFLFHRSIVRASKNNILVMLAEMISGLFVEQIKTTRKTLSSSSEVLGKFREQHWSIFKAIEAQDSRKAEESMIRHFNYAQIELGLNQSNKT